jgi:hypothetical protein
MTCDHNCVVNAGFISESVKSVWRAVRNEVRSEGEGVRGASENRDCEGTMEGVRARLKVCLRERKFLELEDEMLG